MRHLCLISLIWALALSLPGYLLGNKQLTLAIAQQENIKKQLELKQVEQQLLQKLIIPSEAEQKKSSGVSLDLF